MRWAGGKSSAIEKIDNGVFDIRKASLLALFFASGSTSLAYEVLWTKILTLSIGTNVIAVSAVVSSFMGGLALGAYAIGDRIDRYSNPLKIYAYLELGVGLWAIILLPLLKISSPLYARLQFAFGLSGTAHNLIVFILAFFPLLVPAVLMGGTLPSLLSHIERSAGKKKGGIGTNVSLLYGVNTCGAVFGTVTCGFFLIGKAGIVMTNLLTASVNLVIFVIAWILSSRWEPLTVKSRAGDEEFSNRADQMSRPGQDALRRNILITLYVASGFTALAYEIVWTRVLIHYVGTTSYAFTLMLAIYLLGIGAGSFIYRLLKNIRDISIFHFGVAELLIGFTGGMGVLAVVLLTSFHLSLLGATDSYWWKEALIIMLASGSLMILPTLILGFAFPLVSELVSEGKLRAGKDVGIVYSANTLGSIAGSMAAAFLFLPLLGSGGSILLFSAINLVIAGIAFMMTNLRLSIPFATASFALAIILPVLLPSSIHSHMFPEEATLFLDEGSEATVAVIRDQDALTLDFKRMIVDGNALSGSDYSGRRYMKLLGHLPLILCEDPEKVLVICLGTGMTLGACSRHEDVDQLICVEISPEVVKAARQFTRENYAVLDGGRARLVIGDGRNFLLAYPGTLDVITLEPPPPRARGVVNLYSKDFYELCKMRLSERGVMAQWIPLHDQTEEDVKILIKTFTSVFDHTTAWLIEREDLCLIGTVKPLYLELEYLTNRIRDVRDELADIDIHDAWDLLALYIADEGGLNRYCGEVPVITDDLPLIEHFLSLPWNRTIVSIPGIKAPEKSFLEELLLHRTSLKRCLRWKPESGEAAELLRHRLAMEFFLDGVIHSQRGMVNVGLEEIRKAMRLIPHSEYFKHYLGISSLQRSELEEMLVNNRGDARTVLLRYGFLELEEDNHEKAREVFEKYISLFPDHAVGYLYLAMVYEELGDLDAAEATYMKLAQLSPDQEAFTSRRLSVLEARERVSGTVESLDKLASLYWQDGRYEEAARVYAEMVRSYPSSEPARYNLAASLEAMGDCIDALDEYEIALQLDPGVDETRNNIDKLKVLFAIMSEFPEKVVLSDGTEVDIGFENPGTWAVLGRLYARNDEYWKASRALKRALALDPDYGEARAMLETLEGIIKEEIE